MRRHNVQIIKVRLVKCSHWLKISTMIGNVLVNKLFQLLIKMISLVNEFDQYSYHAKENLFISYIAYFTNLNILIFQSQNIKKKSAAQNWATVFDSEYIMLPTLGVIEFPAQCVGSRQLLLLFLFPQHSNQFKPDGAFEC